MIANDADIPFSYSVEYTEPAEAEVAATYEWLRNRSFTVAERWLTGLATELERLAGLSAAVPGQRHVAPPEEQFSGRMTYLFRYRTRRGGSTWRILYTLTDANDDGELDTLLVLRVRNASVRPTTQANDNNDEAEGLL